MQEQWEIEWKDYYRILNIDMYSSDTQIKEAYRTLIKEYHTDVNPNINAEEKTIELNEAYNILTNSEKRKKYDAFYYLKLQGKNILFENDIEYLSQIFILTIKLEHLNLELQKHKNNKLIGKFCVISGILGEITCALNYFNEETHSKMLMFLPAFAAIITNGISILYKERNFDTTEHLNKISELEKELRKKLYF